MQMGTDSIVWILFSSHHHSFFIFSILLFKLNIPEASCLIILNYQIDNLNYQFDNSQLSHPLLSPFPNFSFCPFPNFYPSFLPLLLTIISRPSLYPHIISSFLHSHSCPTAHSSVFSFHSHLNLASVLWLQEETTGKPMSRCSHRTDLGMIQWRGSGIARWG